MICLSGILTEDELNDIATAVASVRPIVDAYAAAIGEAHVVFDRVSTRLAKRALDRSEGVRAAALELSGLVELSDLLVRLGGAP